MHLRSLGLSKSQTAITFLAGPISGIFAQPLFGLWSDRCRLSWGRRRPFIAMGGLVLIASLLALAWTKSLVNLLFGPDESDESNQINAHRDATIVMANTLTFCLYFSTQPVQVGIRALIIDVCPTYQQRDANAWVVRISGVANVLAYLSAFLDLPQYLSVFGDTQFKNLSVLACLSLSATLLLCCVFVVEENQDRDIPMKSAGNRTSNKSIGKTLFEQCSCLYKDISNLPKQIAYIYMVQFFAWMGWYPYLLYATTYISEIYMAEKAATVRPSSEIVHDATWEHATRVGSLALLISSTVSLLTAIVLPRLTSSLSTWAPGYGKAGDWRNWNDITISWLSMRRLWAISSVLFAISMFSTLFVSSVVGIIIIFGIVGISWAVASWIPYTLLSLEISSSHSSTRTIGPFKRNADQAGIVLGLHNIAICIPQILISLGSSFLWKAHEATPLDASSTGWILRIGGAAVLMASWLTMKKVRDP
ncbi:hypothetical protein OIDMADRAFT_131223 [Oidiodendron maius Zn]|uniref:Major facilitator superfamily (MFS) profile domain-containing protein n=1 Tax=Oidiodendron maius (strain Zn) TaxID=913774 RepID=A0A0C3CCM6_OIDMZ|nr:hypothetical protein OIDMADRAFT_131223 [Oidiodendron maius Zn]